MDDQNPCLYTMYSPPQSTCWNLEVAIVLQTMQIYIPPKRESWIERLDRLIFPADPIRDWVESEIERISRKYAWIDEI